MSAKDLSSTSIALEIICQRLDHFMPVDKYGILSTHYSDAQKFTPVSRLTTTYLIV